MKKGLLVRPLVLFLAFICLYFLAKEIAIRINSDSPIRGVRKNQSSQSNEVGPRADTNQGKNSTSAPEEEPPKQAPQYRLKTNISYQYQNGWKNYSNWSYIYDAAGNNVETIVSEWKDDSWKFQRRIICKYNSKNQLIERIECYLENESWVTKLKSIFTYNEEGDMLVFYWYNYLNPENAVITRRTHSYIGKGKLDKYIEYTLVDTSYIKTSECKTIYNNLGQVTQWRYMKIINGNLVTVWTEDYLYDSEGNQIKREMIRWNDVNLALESKLIENNTYFDKKMTSRTYDNWWKNDWLNFREFFKYNQYGDKEEGVRQQLVNGVWVDWIKDVYYYEQIDETS